MKNVSMNQANYQSTKPFASGFVQARGWREGIQAPQVKLKWMQVIETSHKDSSILCVYFSPPMDRSAKSRALPSIIIITVLVVSSQTFNDNK